MCLIQKLPGTYIITVDPTVTPVLHSSRRVATAMKDIKEELCDAVWQGIITKVTDGQPTELG